VAIAAAHGHIDVVKRLVEGGAKITLRDGHPGLTPLTAAIRGPRDQAKAACHPAFTSPRKASGYEQVVEFLLEKDAPLTHSDSADTDDLAIALRAQCPEVVRLLLLKASFDPNKTLFHGIEPAESSDQTLPPWLAAPPTELTTQTSYLEIAMRNPSSKILEVFLEHTAGLVITATHMSAALKVWERGEFKRTRDAVEVAWRQSREK
jgi:hypothetical protein